MFSRKELEKFKPVYEHDGAGNRLESCRAHFPSWRPASLLTALLGMAFTVHAEKQAHHALRKHLVISIFVLFVCFVVIVHWNRASLYNLGCPDVDQAGQKLRDSPVSALGVLGSNVWATMPSHVCLFLKFRLELFSFSLLAIYMNIYFSTFPLSLLIFPLIQQILIATGSMIGGVLGTDACWRTGQIGGRCALSEL